MNTGRILNYLVPLPIGEFWTSALSCTREYAVFVVLKGLCSLNVERKCRLAWYCKGHLRFIHADHRLYKHSSCLYFGTLFTAQDFAINNANVDFPLRVGTSTVVRLRLTFIPFVLLPRLWPVICHVARKSPVKLSLEWQHLPQTRGLKFYDL